MTDLNLHVPLEGFEVRDGCLCVGGETLTSLMERLGGGPAYIYSADLIRRRIAALKDALPQEVLLHFAIKANPMPDVVRLVADSVDGLDVASAAELDVALATGMQPVNISFAGPGKSEDELARALAAGIVVNAESETEIRRLAALSGTNGRPRVAIRVNPDFELRSSGMKMSGGPKPFGIDAESVPALLDRFPEELDFHGFHIFCGSQNLSEASICDAQQKAVELALELVAHAPVPAAEFNIGGGFGIPYFPGEKPIDLTPIGDNLRRLSARVASRSPDTRLVVELGRFIVGEAGIYVCRVLDKKVSRGKTYLITNGGLHHHLAASGNFGQILRKNYPVAIGNRIGSAATEVASVVGPLCTPLDILGENMTLSRAGIGDLVVVFQSGAYGRSASPLGFLSHPEPGEVLV